MIALDPLLAEPETQQAIGLHRYRADYLARDVWRLAKGRAQWSAVVVGSGDTNVVVVGGGSMGSRKPGFFDVVVPANARMGVEDHQLRLWRWTMHQVWKSLRRPELDDLEEFLHRERFSSVFRVQGLHVRRNEGASEDLARAVLKLMSAVEVRADDRG